MGHTYARVAKILLGVADIFLTLIYRISIVVTAGFLAHWW